jgi:hypothetical protein
MPRSPLLATLLAVALLAAACTGDGAPTAAPASPAADGACATVPAPDPGTLTDWDPSAQRPTLFPVIVSTRQVCGENRFLFSFLRENRPVAAPDRTVSVAFYDLAADPETPVATSDAEFLWAIEDERGLYVAATTFPTAGLWGVEFTTEAPGEARETIRVQFDVHADSPTVAIGEAAPSTDTPTLDDVGGDVALISTDDEPVKAFYETSVADALAGGDPFVLVFATPRFCTSAQCGPTLDRLKPIAAAHPDVTFINVEPFELEPVDGQLQPTLDDAGQLQVVAAAKDWGILTEPWIFVVDGDGIVRGSFEAVAGEQEIERLLDRITAG